MAGSPDPPPAAPIRLGVVGFVNARPLVGSPEAARERGFVVSEHPPAEAGQLLCRGDLDVALVPVPVLLADPDLTRVPGIGIASRGPVDSVLFFHDRPIPEVRRVALDPASRASQALLREILEGRFGVAPDYAECEPGRAFEGRGFHGVLIIGDPALAADPPGYRKLDLGLAWMEWTGLPFVYAVWALRRRLLEARPGIASDLAWLRDIGEGRLPEIAREEAERTGLGAEQLLDYLRNRIVLRLGPEEERGLRTFLERVARRRAIAPRAKIGQRVEKGT